MIEWSNEQVIDWLIDWMNEWMNKWSQLEIDRWLNKYININQSHPLARELVLQVVTFLRKRSVLGPLIITTIRNIKIYYLILPTYYLDMSTYYHYN